MRTNEKHNTNGVNKYLASWLRVLKADKRAIFTAASQAQKAADFLRERATAPVEVAA